jgi:hypothetical protein
LSRTPAPARRSRLASVRNGARGIEKTWPEDD